MLWSSAPCEPAPTVEIEPVRSNAIAAGGAGAIGIADRIVGESAAAAERLDDDADGVVATGQDVAGLRIADVASVAAADALQQHAVATRRRRSGPSR